MLKVKFKQNPLLQYQVLREGLGKCNKTQQWCDCYEIECFGDISKELLEESSDLPDYIDVAVKLGM